MKANYSFFRRWTKMISLMAIVAGALGAVKLAGCCMISLGYVRLVCPVGFLELCLADHQLNMILLPAFCGVVLIIFLGGRFFCSWLCPASIMGQQLTRAMARLCPDSLYRRFKRRTKKIQKYLPQPDYKDALALTFGSFLGIWIFRYPFISTFCPLGVLSRNIIELFTHFRLRYDLFFLVLPGLAAIFWIKGWKNICPLGAVRGMVSRYNRTLVPVVDPNLCNGCKKCERQCTEHLSPWAGLPDLRLCHKCFKCIDICPNHALNMTVLPHKKNDKARSRL